MPSVQWFINYSAIAYTGGAFWLAGLYHTVLYFHTRDSLLRRYSIYLFATAFYLTYRLVFLLDEPDIPGWKYFPLDEIFQMTTIALYIRFIGAAMEVSSATRWAYHFWRTIGWVMAGYLVVHIAAYIDWPRTESLAIVSKLAIRVYLLVGGFVVLLHILRERHSIYYRYLAAGAIAIIGFGLASTLMHFAFYGKTYIGALVVLMTGYFLDVVFFSAAIGYRLRKEGDERSRALQTVLDQQTALQAAEVARIQAVHKTQEEERLRIAQDLHDDIGSTLSALHIYSGVAEAHLESEPEKTRGYLRTIGERSTEMMDSVSDLIWSLQSHYNRGAPLHERIREHARDRCSSAGMEMTLKLDATPCEMDVMAQKSLWLIFKEALNNACKYSRAAHCTVSLSSDAKQLTLTVADDGVGFTPNGHPGNGLRNMEARAAALGGALEVRSAPGEGTTIRAQFPLTSLQERSG